MKMNTKTEKTKKAMILALMMNSVLIVDLSRMLMNDIYSDIIFYIIYISIAFYVYKDLVIDKRLKVQKDLFFLIIGILMICLLSYIISPDVAQGYSYLLQFIISRSIPAMYLMAYINEDTLKQTLDYMTKYRILWLFYAFAGYIYISSNSWDQYSMTFGYNLLMPACVCFLFCLKDKKVRFLVYTAIFLVVMMLRGSRGSVVCALFFWAFTYIFTGKQKSIRVILAGGISIFIVTNIQGIAKLLLKVLPESRTLHYLSTNFLESSGRDEIAALFVDAIKKNPFKINGILADRVYYGNKMLNGRFELSSYPHNFMLEIVFQFGTILGIAFLTIFFYAIIKSILYVKSNNDYYLTGMYFLLLASGVVKLLFSASYLTSVEFYLHIGFDIYILRRRKMEKSLETMVSNKKNGGIR